MITLFTVNTIPELLGAILIIMLVIVVLTDFKVTPFMLYALFFLVITLIVTGFAYVLFTLTDLNGQIQMLIQTLQNTGS